MSLNPTQKSIMLLSLPAMAFVWVACASAQTNQPAQLAQGELGADVPAFWVRPGFKVTVAASELEEARFMEFDDKGNLYLARPNHGDVVTMRKKGDKYVIAGTLLSGKRSVHGLCWHNGWLWFAQTSAIGKARDTNGDGKADEVVTVIPEDQLPRGGGHWWRSILVTDQHIFTSIGDMGNATDPGSTERQKMFQFNLDGTGKKLWSSGIRNTEKLRMRPGTNEIYGLDHGSDWFGGQLGDKEGNQPITDLNPPEELNLYEEGKFYGHPFLVGNRVPRIEYQNRPDIIELAAKTEPPAWCLPAHWAGNGWTFLITSKVPEDYKGDIFAAYHGSWNSKMPVGYRVERICFDKATGKPFGNQSIVVCLDPSGRVLGRPVDCVESPDGSILFTDDQSNRIFRIAYMGKK